MMNQVWESHNDNGTIHNVGLIAEFLDRAEAMKFCVLSGRPCVEIIGSNGARMTFTRDKEGVMRLTIDGRRAKSVANTH